MAVYPTSGSDVPVRDWRPYLMNGADLKAVAAELARQRVILTREEECVLEQARAEADRAARSN